MAAKTTPDDRIDFVYALEGRVESVDVFALAPALLAMGKVIRDSNEILHPMTARVGVSVKPFRPGSFLVDIAVYVQSPEVQQVIGPVAMSSAQAIEHTLRTLGLIAGGGKSLIELLRLLKNRKAEVEPAGPDEFVYRVGNENLVVGAPVHQLMKNSIVVQNFTQVYNVPLQTEGVDAVASYLPSRKAETQVRVTRADAPPDLRPVELEPAIEIEPPISVVHLRPKRGSFDGDGKNWSFWLGKNVIRATIKDAAFLARYERGEVRLHASDVLKVELREVGVVREGAPAPTVEVLKVLEYLPSAKQGRLPTDDQP